MESVKVFIGGPREETEEERQQRVHEQYLRAMEAFGVDPNEKFDDDL